MSTKYENLGVWNGKYLIKNWRAMLNMKMKYLLTSRTKNVEIKIQNGTLEGSINPNDEYLLEGVR